MMERKPKKRGDYMLRTKIPDRLKVLPKLKFCTYRKYRPEYIGPDLLLILCSNVVDNIPNPPFWGWSEYDIAEYITEKMGCPDFQDAFIRNKIRGIHIALVEADRLPQMDITDFEAIKKIAAAIRELCSTDQDEFKRSISLPIRRPITLYLWYKTSRGPRDTTTPSQHLRIRNIIRDETTEGLKYYYLLNHWNRIPPYRPWCPHVTVGEIRRINPMTGTTLRKNYHPSEKFYLLKDLCTYPSEFEKCVKNINIKSCYSRGKTYRPRSKKEKEIKNHLDYDSKTLSSTES